MLTNAYKQTATYWGAPVSNGMGGYTFSAPQQLSVRWEERNEQYTQDNGEVNVSEAVVFVKEDVEIGGYLYLGETSNADPTLVDGAHEIKQVIKIPDLRNLFQERRAFL